MRKKKLLLRIIHQRGECHGIVCSECMIDSECTTMHSRLRERQYYSGFDTYITAILNRRYRLVLGVYIKLYGKESLVEELL